jgi:3-oxoadipate enol-lactonase
MTTRYLHHPSQELHRAGTNLHYWLHGPQDGPVVTLTHGLSLDRHAFDAQVPTLVDAGYRVLTWDIRGHGRSQPMGPSISIAEVVDDLLAVLDDARIDRTVLVGQSFGGMVIQEVAARAPERVTALVVIGAPALGDRPGAVMRVLQRLRIQMIKLWPDGLLRRVFAAMVTEDPEVRHYVASATRQLTKPAFVAVSAAAMEGHLRAAAAPTGNAPVLLVHGQDEERPVARAMHRWSQRNRAADLRILHGGGHLINQENPELFHQVLLAFLEKEAGTRGRVRSLPRPA